jgi:hypothetical protein
MNVGRVNLGGGVAAALIFVVAGWISGSGSSALCSSVTAA